MRFFALGIFASLTLGLGACGDDKDVTTTSATNQPTTAGPTTDDTTTDATGTTGTPTTSATGTTGAPTTGMTTGEPDTTTNATTNATTEPSTTTTGSTGEPGSTGTMMTTGTTGGGVFPEGGDYENCSNAMGMEIMCEDMGLCIDSNTTNGQVKGAFCSPACSGPGNICPKPMGIDPSIQALCAFDTNADMKPDICALICTLPDAGKCPNGAQCEDIGIPEMNMMKFGVCTFPAG